MGAVNDDGTIVSNNSKYRYIMFKLLETSKTFRTFVVLHESEHFSTFTAGTTKSTYQIRSCLSVIIWLSTWIITLIKHFQTEVSKDQVSVDRLSTVRRNNSGHDWAIFNLYTRQVGNNLSTNKSQTTINKRAPRMWIRVWLNSRADQTSPETCCFRNISDFESNTLCTVIIVKQNHFFNNNYIYDKLILW